MSRCGRWQCSPVTPGDSGWGGKASPVLEAACFEVTSGNLPPSPVYGETGSPSREAQFSYSVCSQIGVTPWSQISG